MQLLTPNETPLLLSVLLSGSDTRSLGSLKLQFEEAFAPPDRFRACCAAVLLLEVRQRQPPCQRFPLLRDMMIYMELLHGWHRTKTSYGCLNGWWPGTSCPPATLE